MSEGASPSLRTSFGWAFVGNASFAGSQWLTVIVLARAGSPSMVGAYTLGFALAAPIYMLFNLQLRAVQATDARCLFRFSDYAGLRLLSTVGATAVTVLVAVVVSEGTATMAVLLIGLAKAVEAFSDLTYGELQRTERMRTIGVSLLLRGPGAAAAFAFLVSSTGSLLVALCGLVLVWALVLLLHDLPAAAGSARLTPSFDAIRLRKIILLSLPLGAVMMLISLTYNVPRYFVEHELGTAALGYFAAVSYLAVAGTTFVNSLGEAASPRLARFHASGDRMAFTALVRKLVAVGAAFGAVSVLVSLVAGRELLRTLYGDAYARHDEVFVLTMVAAAVSFVASFLGFGITAARRFGVQPVLVGAVTAVVAVVCAVLVPEEGLAGAAWALVAGSVTHLAGNVAISAQVLRRLGDSSASAVV